MSFPFSFFTQRQPRAASPEVQVEVGTVKMEEKAASMSPKDIEKPQAQEPDLSQFGSGGLAALAVQQSLSVPLGPPPRRLASYMAPAAPAIAASLAFAAPAPATPRQPELESVPAPAANHFNAVQSLQSRDLSQLRVELEAEMEQMRNDLFGAAMGVSTLKDRLDGLESSLDKNTATPGHISAGEIEVLVQNWLETHLAPRVDQAVQATLDQAMQSTVTRLSSHEFFRLNSPLSGFCPETFLSQPPQILSASLT